MNHLFASRIRDTRTSKIRERLEIPPDAGLISFASSLPTGELFPVKDIEEATKEAFVRWQDSALRYSQSEGIAPLREKIARRVNSKLMTTYEKNNICVTTGSQQGFDIIGKLFINEGDVALYEPPMQLSFLMAFANYGVKFVEISSDDNGMIIEDLEAALRLEKQVKLVYICPDYMRPSGKAWSMERRRAFFETVSDFDVMVVEDVTFSDFRFEGEALPAVASFDKKGQFILAGSFSRIFCPGVRLGWLCVNDKLMEHIRKIKRSCDLNSSSLDQHVLNCYLEKFNIEDHIRKLIEFYRERRDLLDSSMQENFPKAAVYPKPDGGLYTWVKLEGLNARELLENCIKQNVAFVPGDSFYSRGSGDDIFRLSFTTLPTERIRAGVRRIAKGMSDIGFHPSTRVTINPQAYLELNESDQRKVLLS
ncbi:MAG: PLP-dependent aminotransferase family protein [Synergistaceae bacterium]|nr:PLP-dependent aminotransferase family protein [Synergistaceae bacterium]